MASSNQTNWMEVTAKNKKVKKKIVIIGIPTAIAILAIVSLIFFLRSGSDGNTTSELTKPDEPPFVKSGQLAFLDKDKNVALKIIDIEIADDDAKRVQGLMWRRSMADNAGMLFIFEEERPQAFWMRNTYIPLDIIYADKSGVIVTISENCKPLVEYAISSEKPAQFVVEVNAGFSTHYKITTGDKIKFDRLKN
jgi:uncharacterized protein